FLDRFSKFKTFNSWKIKCDPVNLKEKFMTFLNAVKNTPVYSNTENGAVTLKSSNDALVDLFFQSGSARNWSEEQIRDIFVKALVEDTEKALRLVFWLRDVRGGAGERRAFRVCMEAL